MKNLLPLMQREWLQHRFGWALLAGIPLGLALLLGSVGQVEIDAETITRAGPHLAMLVAMVTIVVAMAVLFAVFSLSSGIIASGLARRDHADRSIEFWMSVPVSHSESLAVPLFVHLLVVPAAALVVGLLGGYVVSLVAVTRVVGMGAWFSLPWVDLVLASTALMLRVLAGLPLAMLWLSPLILLVVLLTAQFRRWGWVILIVGLGLGSLLLKQLLGQAMLMDLVNGLLQHGGRALINGDQGSVQIAGAGDGIEALRRMPGWALSDFGAALRDLASPLLLGGLLFAAACFALLVQWRQRGAGASA